MKKIANPGNTASHQTKVPVVPVALNSGLFWGRRKFIKWPGVIDVEILPAIPPGLGREVFMATLEKDSTAGTDEALLDIYRKLRPGEPLF